MLKNEQDPHSIYSFFGYIYDKAYVDVMLGKIPLSQTTFKLIELLALPLMDKPILEQKNILKNILRRAAYIKMKFGK
jgi:hypothetical protein